MCGIIGYVGSEQAAPILLHGLSELEYRGYDSSGIAVLDGDHIEVEKRAGKLGVLRSAVEGIQPVGTVGIGHTRWATHGGVTDKNAHPHRDCTGDLAVIHNGIVENFVALRAELQDAGHIFMSETDTEVVSHLIEHYLNLEEPLLEATRLAVNRLEGAAALVVVSSREPDQIIGARISNAGAVVVGYGEGEMFVASDLLALLKHTRRVAYLAHGELTKLTRDGATYIDSSGAPVVKQPVTVPYDPVSAEKGLYRHFMQKEIFEQPSSLTYTIGQYADIENNQIRFEGVPFTPQQVARIRRVVLVAMGTSLHAAMIGRCYFERISRIPAEVDNASEFRYRRPVIGPDTLVVSLSQSGETVDTLAAMEEAGRHKALQITICNVDGAQTTRIADGTILTRCGLEKAVASTKTYVASIAVLYMLSAWLGTRQGTLDGNRLQDLLADLIRVPNQVARVLEASDSPDGPYADLVRKYGNQQNALFLGRGLQYPVAMEGALKLKEISYMHAEGYPAGEMKHGPIALIDREMPVIVLAPRDSMYDKMCSNIQQIEARKGRTIAVGTEGEQQLQTIAEDVILVPQTSELLLPIVTSIPLQLLAYAIATARGNDVDQPRNLAKTVTVE